MKLISSKDNSIIKQLARLLSSKKERNDKGLFVVEGVRLCHEMAKCSVEIEKTFLTEKCMTKFPQETELILKRSGENFEITDAIADKISETKTAQGIFCLCKIPRRNNEIKKNGNYIMLCSLQDPGNIGTIIRTCDAFKTDGLIMTEDCPDIYSSKLLRSTMGTAFRTDIKIFKNAEEACEKLKEAGIKIYAAALKENSKKITEFDLSKNVCVMIGNEGNGLKEEEIALADDSVIIPMNEESESLNAGIAASVFAWEMFKGKI